MGLPALIHSPARVGRIHRVGFGWINVDGRVYEQDRVLHLGGVSRPWWRRPRHVFALADAEALVQAHAPEHIVIGCGWMGMLHLDTAAATWLTQQGVSWAWLRTPAAAAEYNNIHGDSRRVIAALHLTC